MLVYTRDAKAAAYSRRRQRNPSAFPSKRKLTDVESDPDGVKMRRLSPSPPFTSDSPSLQFFVRTFSKSIVVRADATDTVGSVLARVCYKAGTSASDQRLIYRGRQLDVDKRLDECLIANDASLDLTGRLRSTRHPRAWQLATDIVSSARSTDHNLHDRVREFLRIAPIPTLAISSNNDETATHLQVFIDSGAPIVLVNLYLSRSTFCAMAAENAIRLFLSSDTNHISKFLHLRCLNILMEFCNLLAKSAGREDRLYLACRTTLATLLHWQDRSFFRKSSTKLVRDLFPFVEDLGQKVLDALSSNALQDLGDTVSAFSIFLNAIKKAIGEGMEVGCPIPKVICCTANPHHEWIGSLHSLFISLLDHLISYLKRIETALQSGLMQDELLWDSWLPVLDVLTEANVFSKIFEDSSAVFHAFLLSRRVSINALLKRAKKDDKLHWFLKHRDVTDFEARRNLVLMLFDEGNDDFEELHEMLIDRSKLLEESFEYIIQAKPSSLRAGLFMEFKNEEATGPGVLREWFYLLCKEVFSPQRVLFLQCPNDKRRFFPNQTSSVDPLHLKYFNFCGRFIALALMHKVQLGIALDRVFFLQLAGKPVTLEDVKDADPELYKGCKDILNMDTEYVDSDRLGLTFVREIKELGTLRAFNLCPGGNDISVNSKNREEYVKLLINHHFVTSISHQVSQFAQGFEDIFPTPKHKNLFFRSLDLEDFDRILEGSACNISVMEWKAYTEYDGYQASDREVYWFWQIVEEMSFEQKTALLFFWTSVRFLPIDGFGGLASKLYIYNNKVSQDHLPSSQTCFYRLKLPRYSSKKAMRLKILFVAQDNISRTFGLF